MRFVAVSVMDGKFQDDPCVSDLTRGPLLSLSTSRQAQKLGKREHSSLYTNTNKPEAGGHLRYYRPATPNSKRPSSQAKRKRRLWATTLRERLALLVRTLVHLLVVPHPMQPSSFLCCVASSPRAHAFFFCATPSWQPAEDPIVWP
jgi:hypothetical protein